MQFNIKKERDSMEGLKEGTNGAETKTNRNNNVAQTNMVCGLSLAAPFFIL